MAVAEGATLTWALSGVTVTVTVLDADFAPSVAVSLSRYVPASVNDATVPVPAGSVKNASPGPSTTLHCVVSAPDGRASSLTTASSRAWPGRLNVASGTASTYGAAFDTGGGVEPVAYAWTSFSPVAWPGRWVTSTRSLAVVTSPKRTVLRLARG